jgi:NTP pyrophosphatase (non-canonical NTP hydrolase)
MEQILKTKDAKYEGRQYNLQNLITHLSAEMGELEDEIISAKEETPYRLGRIMDECIDVANMCMYVHDECAALIGFNR